jgi:excisionase family DNA binding protein
MKAVPKNPNMLTTTEVAYLLHVHPNTVRQWANKGLLRAYRLGTRGDRRFRREDIDNFLHDGRGGRKT